MPPMKGISRVEIFFKKKIGHIRTSSVQFRGAVSTSATGDMAPVKFTFGTHRFKEKARNHPKYAV